MLTSVRPVNWQSFAASRKGLAFVDAMADLQGDSPKKLGLRIAEAMRDAGLTQGALERRGQWSRGYISRLVNGGRGARPSAETIDKLVRILAVRREWLLRGEEPKRLEIGSEKTPREAGIKLALERGMRPEHIERVLPEVDRMVEALDPEHHGASLEPDEWAELLIVRSRKLVQLLAEQSPLGKKKRSRKKTPETAETPEVAAADSRARRRAAR